MDKMKIDIWSDIACPHCYIGKRKMDNALAAFPHRDQVELVWHSYELNPTLPKAALDMPFLDHFVQSHGVTPDEARANFAQATALAKEVGLQYNFDRLVVANTSDALRLVKLAAKSGLATDAEEVLFKAYFVESKDVSDSEVLKQLGVSIGLKESDIEQMLASDVFLDDIEKDIEFSENTLNLQFIPFYLFNNKTVVQGSIAEEEYLKIIEQAFADWQQNGVSDKRGDSVSGRSCSIDGHCSI